MIPMTTKHPNIVILLLDTARADRFSSYGNGRETTPFLDSLVDNGTRYAEAYSTSIWSLPTYTSLFTGKTPSSHGIYAWEPTAQNDLIPALNTTYETISVSPHVMGGGWGLVDPFDRHERTVVPHKTPMLSPDPVLDKIRGDNPSLSKIASLIWRDRSLRTVPNALFQLYKKNIKYRLGYCDDSGAVNTLNRAKAAVAEAGEPFFLFTNFVESHMPIYIPREWVMKYSGASSKEVNNLVSTDLLEVTYGDQNLDINERDLLFDLHDASLAYLDMKISDFYDFLQKQGVADNTVFVVLSDHGDLYGEQGIWGHRGKIHRNLCRVPLLIRYPWDSPNVVQKPVSITGLFDPLVDISNGKRTAVASDGPVFVEYSGEDETTLVERGVSPEPWIYYRVACISNEWKLEWRADDKVELNPLGDEKIDVSDEHPEVVEKLKGMIRDNIGNPADLHNQLEDGTATDNLGAETRQHLKSLGYIVGDES